jgi:hypothetical protein
MKLNDADGTLPTSVRPFRVLLISGSIGSFFRENEAARQPTWEEVCFSLLIAFSILPTSEC